MDEIIEKLELCGWRKDQAWILIEDYIKKHDFEELDELVRLEECGLCG